MTYRTLCLLTLTAAISACSTKPTGPITPPPTSASAISKWETSGRVGIRTKEDAISGNFNWQQDPATFALNIVGPFGQGAIKLSKNMEGIVTLAYDDVIRVGSDPAILLQQELGWEFPVKQVTYWMRGLPAPTSTARITNDPQTGLVNQLEQDGWLITYSNFTDVDGLLLPQKMQVSNPPYKVNLIINQWTIQ
ncbi:lipoprotein insertase outer membrane protein LolB [Marinomonas algarum]|uniref:Outer-membrane lipoprotein LolB n=1 Tax=Marinomonas algarum TaxID=2883105 RepID=A0A9X1LFA9_9GAMM|nr:lipoprotein insertase outer membrane protein LolB [Marinomonas algarum]MCB5162896.1 lipoprotein insertase outer membrane protein LolB [Marinomonas algarum]